MFAPFRVVGVTTSMHPIAADVFAAGLRGPLDWCVGGSGVEFGDEGVDAVGDLVSYGSDRVGGLVLGVRYVPVEVAFSRDVWAGVSAAHRDDDVGALGEPGGEALWAARGEIDAELAHDVHHFGV